MSRPPRKSLDEGRSQGLQAPLPRITSISDTPLSRITSISDTPPARIASIFITPLRRKGGLRRNDGARSPDNHLGALARGASVHAQTAEMREGREHEEREAPDTQEAGARLQGDRELFRHHSDLREGAAVGGDRRWRDGAQRLRADRRGGVGRAPRALPVRTSGGAAGDAGSFPWPAEL